MGFSHEKIGGKHSTAIEAAESIVDTLIQLHAVHKISLGYIDNYAGRSGNGRVKIIFEDTSLLLSVTGGGANQEVRVFTSDQEAVAAYLQEKHTDVEVSVLDRRS